MDSTSLWFESWMRVSPNIEMIGGRGRRLDRPEMRRGVGVEIFALRDTSVPHREIPYSAIHLLIGE
jgi:hypothetical protein